MKLPPAYFTAIIGLEDLNEKAYLASKAKGRNHYDVEQKIVDRLLRLKYVEETCFSHQVWIRVDMNTKNPAAAARRLAKVQEKVARLFKQYH